MSKIRNTKDEMERPGAAIDFLRMGIAVGASNAIELQESAGQREVVMSAQLPTAGLSHIAFAAIKVIGLSEGDPMFSDVVLPPGWTKRATDHSMWSDLRDDKGRKRGAIFYKAAFYDRSAHISAERRYYCGRDWNYEDAVRFHVKDTGTGDILFVTDDTPDPYPSNGVVSREESTRREGLESVNAQAAAAWINERFPQWLDAAAYWD